MDSHWTHWTFVRYFMMLCHGAQYQIQVLITGIGGIPDISQEFFERKLDSREAGAFVASFYLTLYHFATM